MNGSDQPTWVGVAHVTILVEGATTLKEKRSVVVSLVERVRRRFPVSAARVGDPARLDREVVACSIVNGDPEVCRSVLASVLDFVDAQGSRTVDARIDVDRWD